MGELVSLRLEPPIAWITLQRPEKLNALSRQSLEELRRLLGEAAVVEDTPVVAITGEGERAFCAGADVGELASLPPERVMESNLLGHEVFAAVEALRKPVVAAINGYALGGGLELALACDLRVAVRGSRMGLPEVSLGVIPGWGGTWRLREAVGSSRAREMILTGRLMDADEALNIGLLSKITPQEELLPAVRELAAQLAENSPDALAAAKNALLAGSADAAGLSLVESGSVASLAAGREFRRRFERRFGGNG